MWLQGHNLFRKKLQVKKTKKHFVSADGNTLMGSLNQQKHGNQEEANYRLRSGNIFCHFSAKVATSNRPTLSDVVNIHKSLSTRLQPEYHSMNRQAIMHKVHLLQDPPKRGLQLQNTESLTACNWSENRRKLTYETTRLRACRADKPQLCFWFDLIMFINVSDSWLDKSN